MLPRDFSDTEKLYARQTEIVWFHRKKLEKIQRSEKSAKQDQTIDVNKLL